MSYDFEQDTDYCGDAAKTGVSFYHDVIGLTIESDISTPRLSGNGVYVHQCVVAVLPDSEGVKLRDYLISKYPLGE